MYLTLLIESQKNFLSDRRRRKRHSYKNKLSLKSTGHRSVLVSKTEDDCLLAVMSYIPASTAIDKHWIIARFIVWVLDSFYPYSHTLFMYTASLRDRPTVVTALCSVIFFIHFLIATVWLRARELRFAGGYPKQRFQIPSCG